MPVSPSGLSNIARLYAANQSRRSEPRNRTTSAPARNLLSGTCRAGPIGPPHWNFSITPYPLSPPNTPQPSPDAENLGCFLHQPILPYGDLLHLGLSPSTASTTVPEWIDAGDPEHIAAVDGSTVLTVARNFDTPLDCLGGNGGVRSFVVNRNGPFLSNSQAALPPRSRERHDSISGNDGLHAGTVSTGVISPDAAIATSSRRRPQSCGTNSTKPSTTLSIVQYTPTDCSRSKSSKKRPAFEELVLEGLPSQTSQKILREDKTGQVKGTMMTFGKPIKKRTAFSEEKRQLTAQARREGVCRRCKKSKRQVRAINALASDHPCSDILFSVIYHGSRAPMSAVPFALTPGYTRTFPECPASERLWKMSSFSDQVGSPKSSGSPPSLQCLPHLPF
jgi:hypothetical protein